MVADKRLKMCLLQIDSCLQHEFSDLFVKRRNKTLKRRRIERMELSFILQMVKYGGFTRAEAELIVWASKKRGLYYVKQHNAVNPTGNGRGSNYLRLYLQEIVAPLKGKVLQHQ